VSSPRQEFAKYAHDLVTDVALVIYFKVNIIYRVIYFHLHSEATPIWPYNLRLIAAPGFVVLVVFSIIVMRMR